MAKKVTPGTSQLVIPEGGATVISVTVYAHDLPSSGVTLQFYEGDPLSGGTPIGIERMLGDVMP